YSPPSISDFGVNVDVKAPSISLDVLTKHLAAAAGPKNAANEDTGPDPNPQWPNSGQPWSQKFAPRAASGISDVVNKSFGELIQRIAEILKSSGASLTGHVTSINSAIEGALSQVTQGAIITERRSD